MTEKYQQLLKILQTELQPALGCTGPIGICIAAAEARDAVGGTPKKITVIIDKDMCSKNADVGIPGTTVVGNKISAALGAFAGKAGRKMEVLENITPEDEQKAEAFAKTDNVVIIPDWETEKIGVYYEAIVETENGVGRAIVAKTHSNLVYKAANDHVILDTHFDRVASLDESVDPISQYKLHDFYDFVSHVPIEDLAFIKDGINLNLALAQAALDGKVGVGLGKSMYQRAGNDVIKKSKAVTCAGSEARMAGCDLPAMSCATSGNAGITCTLPIYTMANCLGIDEEKMLRSVALSAFMTIYGKNRIGRHSAMCACVVAASEGVAAGCCYLMGGTEEQVSMAINNTIVNVFGVVCDGARIACALKLSSAAGIAMEGAYLAIDNVCTPPDQGVAGPDADHSIDFMGNFARNCMVTTDMMLCRALYEKRHN